MLKNRVDKLVLKAFLELELPQRLRQEAPELAQKGEELRSLANRLLMGRNESIEILTPCVLSKEDKTGFNAVIGRMPESDEKRDLVFYYRLAVLVEMLLLKYRA